MSLGDGWGPTLFVGLVGLLCIWLTPFVTSNPTISYLLIVPTIMAIVFVWMRSTVARNSWGAPMYPMIIMIFGCVAYAAGAVMYYGVRERLMSPCSHRRQRSDQLPHLRVQQSHNLLRRHKHPG